MVLKGDSCHNVSFLPEAVQVAVGICSPQLGGGPEDGLGLRAREDELYTILSINAYE